MSAAASASASASAGGGGGGGGGVPSLPSSSSAGVSAPSALAVRMGSFTSVRAVSAGDDVDAADAHAVLLATHSSGSVALWRSSHVRNGQAAKHFTGHWWPHIEPSGINASAIAGSLAVFATSARLAFYPLAALLRVNGEQRPTPLRTVSVVSRYSKADSVALCDIVAMSAAGEPVAAAPASSSAADAMDGVDHEALDSDDAGAAAGSGGAASLFAVGAWGDVCSVDVATGATAWHVSTRELLRDAAASTAPRSVAGNGNLLLVGMDSGHSLLLDVRTPTLVRTLSAGRPGTNCGARVLFDPLGHWAYTSTDSGFAAFHVSSGQAAAQLPMDTCGQAACWAGGRLVTAGASGRVFVWDGMRSLQFTADTPLASILDVSALPAASAGGVQGVVCAGVGARLATVWPPAIVQTINAL